MYSIQFWEMIGWSKRGSWQITNHVHLNLKSPWLTFLHRRGNLKHNGAIFHWSELHFLDICQLLVALFFHHLLLYIKSSSTRTKQYVVVADISVRIYLQLRGMEKSFFFKITSFAPSWKIPRAVPIFLFLLYPSQWESRPRPNEYFLSSLTHQ